MRSAVSSPTRSGALDGAQVPGGCEHCAAFQTVKPITAGVWTIDVHHDDACTWLASMETRR